MRNSSLWNGSAGIWKPFCYTASNFGRIFFNNYESITKKQSRYWLPTVKYAWCKWWQAVSWQVQQSVNAQTADIQETDAREAFKKENCFPPEIERFYSGIWIRKTVFLSVLFPVRKVLQNIYQLFFINRFSNMFIHSGVFALLDALGRGLCSHGKDRDGGCVRSTGRSKKGSDLACGFKSIHNRHHKHP